MFPDVNRQSFCALKRFCHKKPFASTKIFIDKIWSRDAINTMMFISSTSDLDSLVNWLINPDLDSKLSIINNSI